MGGDSNTGRGRGTAARGARAMGWPLQRVEADVPGPSDGVVDLLGCILSPRFLQSGDLGYKSIGALLPERLIGVRESGWT